MNQQTKDETLEPLIQNIALIRENILDKLIAAIALIALIPLCASLYRIKDIGWQNTMVVQLAGFVIICFTAVFRKRLAYYFKAGILILLAFLIGCLATINMGMLGSGMFFIFSSILFSTIFVNVRTSGILLAASVILLMTVAYGVNGGWISYNFNIEAVALSSTSWVSKTCALLFFSTFKVLL